MSKNPIEAGYITVADRLVAFNEKYPDGLIQTNLIHATYDPSGQTGFVIVKAEVWKDRKNADEGKLADGTGLASMPIPGVTNFTRGSEVENTDTSAVGRALAMIGFLAKNPDGSARISSDEEIKAKKSDAVATGTDDDSSQGITQRQRGMIFAKAKAAGIDPASAEGKKLLQKITKETTGKFSSKQLTNADVDPLVAALDALVQVVESSGGDIEG